MPKTGTTSIQRHLARNAWRGEWRYPVLEGRSNQFFEMWGLLFASGQAAPRTSSERSWQRDWKRWQQSVDSDVDHAGSPLVISAESLVAASAATMDYLLSWLCPGSRPAQLVMTIRDPAAQFVSLYKQRLRNWGTPSFRDFVYGIAAADDQYDRALHGGRGVPRLPDAHRAPGRYIMPSWAIHDWRGCVHEAPLSVVCYREGRGDILPEFLASAGLPGFPAERESSRANLSSSACQMFALALYRRTQPSRVLDTWLSDRGRLESMVGRRCSRRCTWTPDAAALSLIDELGQRETRRLEQLGVEACDRAGAPAAHDADGGQWGATLERTGTFSLCQPPALLRLIATSSSVERSLRAVPGRLHPRRSQ